MCNKTPCSLLVGMLSNPDSAEESFASEGNRADDELTTQAGSDSNLATISGCPISDLEKGVQNLNLNSIETKAEIHVRQRKSSVPPDFAPKQENKKLTSKNLGSTSNLASQSSVSSIDSITTGAKPKLKKKRSGSNPAANKNTGSATNLASNKATSSTCKFKVTHYTEF